MATGSGRDGGSEGPAGEGTGSVRPEDRNRRPDGQDAGASDGSRRAGEDAGAGAGGGSDRPADDNPFAPPPEGTPDQEWRPRGRTHAHTHPQDHEGSSPDGEGGEGDDRGGPPPPWGSQWSPRQPGSRPQGLGDRPGGDPQGGPGGLRWDPTDPSQRRARYALLAGMWAFFFVLFSLPEVGLLLGALAVYWGVSSLRAKPKEATGKATATAADLSGGVPRQEDTPAAPPAPAPGAPRPQATAAIGGLVTAGIALLLVAGSFTVRIVYQDYYACVSDALTHASRQSCENLLPTELRPLLSAQD
ncbi:hypothetical protein ACFV3R_07800 [Streptomyces sp. NPDC059740]|uniref:hypothetical protein n=1 Tax=Streptomyces sp. NPDC059740 TaxID=3346926 RepID=UPI00365B6D6B